MTYCDTLAEPLIRRVEVEKKTLDQIAKELCGNTVKRPRQKAIRIIRELLGEEYLIKHAESLGYNTGKAVRKKSTTHEVVKRKIVSEKVVEDSEDSGETEQEQGLEEHDKPAACCQQIEKAVQKREIVSENMDSEEETQDELQEIAVERNVSNEPDNTAPDKNEFNELVGEIKRLIFQYSFEDVMKALAFAESEV
jgi:hypothetical protein